MMNIDPPTPRKFVGIINAIWIITIWMAFMCGIILATIWVYKETLGIYTIESDVKNLEERVHQLEIR